MRQVIYESVATDASAAAMAPDILRGARPFNGLNGVTGLLCAANDRFLQVLEGPDDSVGLALDRIHADHRHQHIEILSDRTVETRAFADWSMAYRDLGHPAGLLDERRPCLRSRRQQLSRRVDRRGRMRVLVADTPREIGERFKRFVAA